ncbi:MAG: hypothetical protein QNL62_03595 [Gammaproteobacteria bacterium]|nr:hypothetical protein [Gammaproteobacteria bacterium]
MNVLSEQCSDDLCLTIENEDDEGAFLQSAGIYIDIIKSYSESEHVPMQKKEKDINMKRMQKAFEKLSKQERFGLNVAMARQVGEIDGEIQDFCEMFDTAIHEVIPKTPKYPRRFLLDFAVNVLRMGWINVEENNVNLICILLVMMEETGIKHDADAIAKDAKDIVSGK